jgi:AmpD protein
MSRRAALDWQFDALGTLSAARFVHSPNFDDRPTGERIELLVVHSISLPPGCFSGSAVADLFANRLDPAAHPFFATLAGLRVSAHFFIRRRGEVFQFVPVSKRAWHAGVSVWNGRERCNDFSVGIELEGCDDRVFTDAQYRQLVRLTRALQRSYPIDEIVGHADIAPGRKTDPGPGFDWARYRSMIARHAQIER